MSSQMARALGDGNIIIQVSGTGNSTIMERPVHLELLRPGAGRRTPKEEVDLLKPEFCAIPLIARDRELGDLRAWAESSSRISVRALIGSGGSGKTRLAQELMLAFARETGSVWDAGLLTGKEARRFSADQNLSAWGWTKHTLIVVDDAASVTAELRTWLAELSQNERGSDSARLRVLLLERHADVEAGWYSSLVSGDWQSDRVRDLFNPWQPVALAPVSDVADRRSILQSTLERGAAMRNVPAPHLPEAGADVFFEKALSAPLWADPLLLMMAGLTALETGVPSALALTRSQIAERLARREVARIENVAPAEHARPVLASFAACLTLCGGLPELEARSLGADLLATGLEYPGGALGLSCDVQKALPCVNGRVEPIRPDLIGEAYLLQKRVWTAVSATQGVSLASGFSKAGVAATLVRTATDLVTHRETRPVQWIDRLVADSSDGELLGAMNDAMPWATLCLRETALRLVQKLILEGDEASSGETSAQDRARLLNILSNRQSGLGKREEALASIEEAVHHYRDLAAARPDALLPDLALSLNNLSNRQSNLGKREEALASIEEAVRLYRELAAARPDAFRPNLALSLNNLSNRQSNLGKREEALASIEEAVRLYRELAAARPDAVLPDLALSLNNLSIQQSGLGKRGEALASIEEAVRIRRELAVARPDAFLPDLAASLNNLSLQQSGLGKREEALASIEEAVRLYRELAAARPDAFLPNLAASLNSLSTMQSELGNREEALASIEEAVRIRRQLAAARPDAFLPDLAGSLNNLSTMQSDLGNREEALASIEEAVRIRRELAAARPDAFLPGLALSLNNLSLQQSGLGKREEALASIEEAVRLYRELAAARPDAFRPELARSVSVLGDCYAAFGRMDEALAAATEALVKLAPAFRAYPRAFNNLANAMLTDYRERCELAGQEPAPEVLEPYRSLWESEP